MTDLVFIPYFLAIVFSFSFDAVVPNICLEAKSARKEPCVELI